MRRNLGLPYKGSKNTIAERIVKCLPAGGSFLDACCGGGAVLEAAYLSRKYQLVHGVDIEKSIVLLLEAVFKKFGSIDYEHRQLVKFEDFQESNARRETLDDAVNRFTASFGFNGYDYQWGAERREIKYLAHQAITLPTLDQRRCAFRDFIGKLISKGTIDGELWSIKLKEIENLHHTEQATNLCRLQKIEQELSAFAQTCETRLEVSVGNMFVDIDYDKYDVIYFDPPYVNTKGYDKSRFNFLMFEGLVTTLVKHGKLVFISEYTAPDGFTEIASFTKQMSQAANQTKVVTERLFFGGTLDEYKALQGISVTSTEPYRSEPYVRSSGTLGVRDDEATDSSVGTDCKESDGEPEDDLTDSDE